jgi:hypothetical protein
MTKNDFYNCSYDEAKEIWERALEGAMDIPGDGSDGEAIIQIQYMVSKLIKDRFDKIN